MPSAARRIRANSRLAPRRITGSMSTMRKMKCHSGRAGQCRCTRHRRTRAGSGPTQPSRGLRPEPNSNRRPRGKLHHLQMLQNSGPQPAQARRPGGSRRSGRMHRHRDPGGKHPRGRTHHRDTERNTRQGRTRHDRDMERNTRQGKVRRHRDTGPKPPLLEVRPVPLRSFIGEFKILNTFIQFAIVLHSWLNCATDCVEGGHRAV
jgi:hypothetical protein